MIKLEAILPAALAAAAIVFAPVGARASESPMTPPPPASGAPALPAMSPRPEALALGRQLAHDILKRLDMASLVAKGMGQSDLATSAKYRPEWPELFRQALVEEVQASGPVLEDIIGAHFAAGFTQAELKAGVGAFEGPGSEEIGALIAAGAAGQPLPTLSQKTQRALAAVVATPDGHSFFDKFAHVDQMLKTADDEIVVRLLPGVFIRFGQKAQAAEAARAGQ